MSYSHTLLNPLHHHVKERGRTKSYVSYEWAIQWISYILFKIYIVLNVLYTVIMAIMMTNMNIIMIIAANGESFTLTSTDIGSSNMKLKNGSDAELVV